MRNLNLIGWVFMVKGLWFQSANEEFKPNCTIYRIKTYYGFQSANEEFKLTYPPLKGRVYQKVSICQ